MTAGSLEPFPADHNAILRDLQRQIDRLAAEVKNISGVPITQASSAFFIPSTATPTAPSGGAYLFYDGSTLRVRTPSTNYSTLAPPFPVAAAVANAANIVSGDGPATYNSTWGHNMYIGLVDVKDQLNALLISLRNAPLLNT